MSVFRAERLANLCAALLCAASALAPRADAATTHQSLLPDSTVVFLHTPSFEQLEKKWADVQFGKVLANDSMAAFRAEWRRFAQTILQSYTQTTGLSADEIIQIARDAVSVAVLPGEQGNAAYVVLADVGDRQEQAERLVVEAGRRLQDAGAVRSVRKRNVTRAAADSSVDVIEYRAAASGAPAREVAYFLHDGVLCISTSIAEADGILSRWTAGGRESLSESEAFQRVMADCAREPGDGPQDGCAFVDPIGCLRVMTSPTEQRLDKQDPVEFLTKHGVDAVRGLGGAVNLATETTDVTVRLSIFAPGPHRGAMGMFRLLSAGQCAPPPWITDDVNMFASLNLDLTAVFDHAGPLFDDVVGDGVEGTFDDILSDLAAEDGPQVDVRSDLVAHLGPRIVLLNDVASSDDPCSERSLVALESKEDAAVALAIKKLLRDDPGVRRFSLAAKDYDLWQIGEDAGTPGGDGRSRKLSSSAAMVAEGHLLLATNVDLIRKLVTAGPTNCAKLCGAGDVNRLDACLQRYTPGEAVGRVYVRTANNLHATYELLRSGGNDPPESLPGMLAEKLLAAFRDRKTGALAIDFTTLPPYERIADKLGWIGATGKNLEDGWYVVGIAIAPNAP